MYPLAEIDDNCDALVQVHDNRKQNLLDDNKKKAQLGVIRVLAMIAQPDLSFYVNTDVTSFSYTVTALSTGKRSVYLSKKMIEFGENYEKIANFSWERRYSDNRLKILSEKISCTRGELKPEIMTCFETGHNSNTNMSTCKTLHDFWHHLWDYRTYRKVVEANISELTEGELAKECLECVPLFRFSLLEIYEKDLESILVKRNT
jgi:hypothetical protein